MGLHASRLSWYATVAALATGVLVFAMLRAGLGRTGFVAESVRHQPVAQQDPEPGDLEQGPGARAYGYLERISALGPRPSGSAALDDLRALVEKHFQECGAVVELQQFQARHPLTKKPVAMTNVIARWRPENAGRILLAAHYDTRPRPDLEPDPKKKRQAFIGANDGASGVALLMEMAHAMPALPTRYGVDFVLFDGEELVYGERGKYFLGSTHFATVHRRQPPPYRYEAAVVVDMIGDRDLQIYQEVNSLALAPELVASIWKVARQLGVREFIAQRRYEIRDDHLPLNTLADIPACLLIDFDYPAWHTTADTPEQCSGASLDKVGRVLLEWLKQLP